MAQTRRFCRQRIPRRNHLNCESPLWPIWLGRNITLSSKITCSVVADENCGSMYKIYILIFGAWSIISPGMSQIDIKFPLPSLVPFPWVVLLLYPEVISARMTHTRTSSLQEPPMQRSSLTGGLSIPDYIPSEQNKDWSVQFQSRLKFEQSTDLKSLWGF
jgi:hypothetical protein